MEVSCLGTPALLSLGTSVPRPTMTETAGVGSWKFLRERLDLETIFDIDINWTVSSFKTISLEDFGD